MRASVNVGPDCPSPIFDAVPLLIRFLTPVQRWVKMTADGPDAFCVQRFASKRLGTKEPNRRRTLKRCRGDHPQMYADKKGSICGHLRNLRIWFLSKRMRAR